MKNFIDDKEPKVRFLHWVHERENLRKAKALIGGTGPWTTDCILSAHRFCNVNREHDAVTLWIKEHVRDLVSRYMQRAGRTLCEPGITPGWAVMNLALARCFNEPESLKQFLPIVPYGTTLEDLQATLARIMNQGPKLFRGAYMMPSHGAYMMPSHGANIKQSTFLYYSEACWKLRDLPWTGFETLEEASMRIQFVEGFGPFLANQIVTDMRYTAPWVNAKDWFTFVLAGPGTLRGLARYDQGVVRSKDAPERLWQIREDIRGYLSPEVREYFLDINNLSNCFCEFDKYERAREQLLNGQRTTLRKYP